MSTYSRVSRTNRCISIAIDELSLNMGKLLISAGFFLRNSVASEGLPLEAMLVGKAKPNPSVATVCLAKLRAFLSHRFDGQSYVTGSKATDTPPKQRE